MASKRSRKKVWLLTVVIVFAIGVLVWFLRPKGDGKVTYNTVKAERGVVSTSVSATGVLQPLTTVQVKSNVGGQVVVLAVDEGDQVKANQLIARIDPSDTVTALEQANADLRASQAKVTQARQQLAMTRAQTPAAIRSAQEGLATARARLLEAQEQARTQPELTKASITQAQQSLNAAHTRLAQAEADAELQVQQSEMAVQQARSSLEAAKASLDQTRTALSPQKVAAAQSSYDQAKANVTYAEKDLARQKELLAKGFVPRSQVEAAEQRYQVAKAQMDSAQNKMDTVKGETQEDLRAAQARVNQAQAALASAEAGRKQADLKQRDVEAARATVKQAEAGLDSATANKSQDTIKQQDVAVAVAAVRQAEAALATARSNSYQEGIREEDIVSSQAQVTRSAATAANARTQLGYTTITAPRDGVVVKKYVEAGSIISAGRSSLGGSGEGVTIVDIADTTRMFAQVSVDETDIAQIEVGQKVDITVDAYPDELFDGKVTKIAPMAVVDQNVTTVPVTVEVDMSDGRLKPNMNATCEFETGRRDDVLMVPNEAINLKVSTAENGAGQSESATDDESYVYVMEGGKPVRRTVEVGLTGNDNTEIRSGLKEGEAVITAVIEPDSASGAATQGGPGGGGMRGGPRGMMGGFH